jgi:hypothetical protein
MSLTRLILIILLLSGGLGSIVLVLLSVAQLAGL